MSFAVVAIVAATTVSAGVALSGQRQQKKAGKKAREERGALDEIRKAEERKNQTQAINASLRRRGSPGATRGRSDILSGAIGAAAVPAVGGKKLIGQ